MKLKSFVCFLAIGSLLLIGGNNFVQATSQEPSEPPLQHGRFNEYEQIFENRSFSEVSQIVERRVHILEQENNESYNYRIALLHPENPNDTRIIATYDSVSLF